MQIVSHSRIERPSMFAEILNIELDNVRRNPFGQVKNDSLKVARIAQTKVVADKGISETGRIFSHATIDGLDEIDASVGPVRKLFVRRDVRIPESESMEAVYFLPILKVEASEEIGSNERIECIAGLILKRLDANLKERTLHGIFSVSEGRKDCMIRLQEKVVLNMLESWAASGENANI